MILHGVCEFCKDKQRYLTDKVFVVPFVAEFAKSLLICSEGEPRKKEQKNQFFSEKEMGNTNGIL